MWVIFARGGMEMLAEFDTDTEAYEATYTGEFPSDCEVAYVNA
jgi:hypothetical protein